LQILPTVLQSLGDPTRKLEIFEVQTQDPVLPLVPASHSHEVADETHGGVLEPPRGEVALWIQNSFFDATETSNVVLALRGTKEHVKPQKGQQKERRGKRVAPIHGGETGGGVGERFDFYGGVLV